MTDDAPVAAEPADVDGPVEYLIGDALEVLAGEPAESATLIHLDDAWARPKRGDAFGVEYPTHGFDDDDPGGADTTDGITTADLIDACERVLAPGGVLVLDADDWLLPRLLEYLDTAWPPADEPATAAGTVTVGNVTELSNDGTPDCSTPGQYLSTGGYSVVLASKHACLADVAADQPAQRQRENYGWGSAKPRAPYQAWVEALVAPGYRVLVPCAGTAPAAIAVEAVHGGDANVCCVDIEPEAAAAFERRRHDELGLAAFHF